MQFNLFIIRLLTFFLLVMSGCNSPQEKKRNDTIKNISQTIATETLWGKRYLYALGCTWNSQSPKRGVLHFYTKDKFRLELYQTIFKQKSKENEGNFPEAYKKEVMEGKYGALKDGVGIQLTFLNSIITLNLVQTQQEKEEKREFIGRTLILDLDSCDDKSVLRFREDLEEFPSEKYYAWVERNYNGKYVSYQEGVKEEITIKDEKNNLQIFYQSPSYVKPIELNIKEVDDDRQSFKVTFPNDSKKVYLIELGDNNLYSSTNDSPFQEFTKITNSFSKKTAKTSLKHTYRGKEIFPATDKDVYDTIVPFLKYRKAKITLSSATKFAENYQKSLFEAKVEELCSNKNQLYKCADAVEKAILQADKWVKREGDILIFPIQKDKKYFLRNNPNFGNGTQIFHYQGVMNTNAGNVFVTYGSYWEWQNYRLLHQKSGEEILITFQPQLSPNRKYLIAADNLSLYTMGGTIVQLWEISDNGFTLVWEFISPDYIPEKFAWLNDKQVLFSATKRFANGEQKEQLTYGKITFE